VKFILLRRLTAAEVQQTGREGRLGMSRPQLRLLLRDSSALAWANSIMPLALLLASPQTWQRVLSALIDATILGGALAVPVMAVVAFVGLWLPPSTGLHQVGGQLFGMAIVWFALALVCAHGQSWRRDGEPARQ
jgi:hypothetical protein